MLPPDLSHRIATAVATGLAGAVIGWAANALTLVGRVSAVESGVARIEAHLDRMEHKREAAQLRPEGP